MVVNGQQWNREVTKYHEVNTTQHLPKTYVEIIRVRDKKNHGGYRKCNSGVERMSGNDDWPFVHWPFVRLAFCPGACCS